VRLRGLVGRCQWSCEDDVVLKTRKYGASGPVVLVLHGGPGAAGYMAPVARGLADAFRVLEPFQRGGGSKPLTVAQHIADLHEVVEQHCGGEQVAIVGHSWGAMLALSYAAAHHSTVGPLALVGCGTFDRAARDRMRSILNQRMDHAVRQRIDHLADEVSDPDERLKAMGELFLPLESYDLATTDQEIETCDGRAYEETWQDVMRLQEEGVYPAAFAAIRAPVIMLHGDFDPHPGAMIRASLHPHLPQLEYYEWEHCGHYPWMEKVVGSEFFSVLRDWLARRFAA